MDGNFIQIHNDFVRSKELRPTEKIVFMCIKTYAYGGECFPSVRKIAEDAGVCMRTVQRCVKVLCDKGFLTVKRRRSENGGNTTNLYKIEERAEAPAAEEKTEDEFAQPSDPALEFRGSDELLRRLGVEDTEKYRRIYRRVAKLGRDHRGEVMNL